MCFLFNDYWHTNTMRKTLKKSSSIKYKIYKIPKISVPNLPLPAYYDNRAFKIYMLDIGLLCAKAELPAPASRSSPATAWLMRKQLPTFSEEMAVGSALGSTSTRFML